MKGVILAAGDGGRLLPLTLNTPKVLLEVAGRPLIHYPLNALHSAGITEIAVVVGHDGHKVIKAFELNDSDIPTPTFIINPLHQGGNALSVEAAHSFTGDEPFVLCMGDHIISPEIVVRLLNLDPERCVVCVDSEPRYAFQIDDGTRVLVGAFGDVIDIGKRLTNWTALDIGLFLLTEQVFDLISRLRTRHGLDVELSQMVRLMGQRGQPFATCDISGLFWSDMDTLGDYEAIDRLIGSGMELVSGARPGPSRRTAVKGLMKDADGTGL